jgi:hypothetical protein
MNASQFFLEVRALTMADLEASDLLKSSGFEMIRVVASAGPDIIEAAPR